ncbi:MAG: tRNA 4-thiouridine(8) synthase ThiI [Lentisphaeria bacterium]|nr:tRNA 4-thiouridine(8) synthase ThiI [Lentisphaeria bacterium]
MNPNAVLCRYGELALKGNNRPVFEKQLLKNLRYKLKQELKGLAVKIVQGRVVIQYPDLRAFEDQDMEIMTRLIPFIFGLKSFSFAWWVPSNLEDIEKHLETFFPQALKKFGDQQEITYRMRVRRSYKKFPLSSHDTELYFAEKFLMKYSFLKVNLREAEMDVALEIRDRGTFVSLTKEMCWGGLPSGTGGKGLALLSGGIDSPVACHKMMARGIHLHYLTFHSFPYTDLNLLEKVGKIANSLNQWQKAGMLFACNFASVQRVIRDSCNPRYRTILYRRFMFRIAEKLSHSCKFQALITGDALAQVASQTVVNMSVIDSATSMLVLRPIVSEDKDTVVAHARKIDTFDISNIQCADSCTVFQPDKPITKAKLREVEYQESKLDIDELVLEGIRNIKFVDLKSGELMDQPPRAVKEILGE